MSIKKERIENVIRKEISEIIQFKVKDNKVGFVTVSDVVVTNDYSYAKVYVTFLGQSARQEAGLQALNKSKGFIRSELAKKLSTYKVPALIFELDDTLEKGNRIEEILKNAK